MEHAFILGSIDCTVVHNKNAIFTYVCMHYDSTETGHPEGLFYAPEVNFICTRHTMDWY
jgi:hypothetical protein